VRGKAVKSSSAFSKGLRLNGRRELSISLLRQEGSVNYRGQRISMLRFGQGSSCTLSEGSKTSRRPFSHRLEVLEKSVPQSLFKTRWRYEGLR